MSDYLRGCDILGEDTIPSVGLTYTDSTTVRAVQTALKDKGYDPGKIDGVYGPNTAKAIRGMQAAVGQVQTGQIDYGVLMALQVSAPSGSSSSSAKVARSSSSAPSFTPSSSGAYAQIVPSASGVPGVPAAGPVSFLQKEAFGGLKVWQAGSLGIAALAIIGGGIAAAVRR